ncbi:unnamed protein product [Thlaspi arvense]|uniref:IspG C-terminal domain-containing protein n=1 Tax=Thlaspi arvense TaxID=13288 RepID=A0AAU9SIL5_THLAR|nr:unnamed protein product [Thlaspi arvense]
MATGSVLLWQCVSQSLSVLHVPLKRHESSGTVDTLFDLQEISAEIREKTSHVPGVSIAIMGCIVNGPGEMADADFGYVGGSPGKIDLYVGKTVVKRGIAMTEATDALIGDQRTWSLGRPAGG